VPAEVAGQRPLLERAAAGDREAFACLFDDQVEGVYRYLLAWTGDRSEATELAGQVFRDAFGRLPVTAAGEVEAGAWLIAMAHDAVARRGPGRIAGPPGPPGPGAPAPDAVAAVARLGDPEREVVVLRVLLGHSLSHTAHLSGHSEPAVLRLQLAACLTVWGRTAGAGAGAPPRDPGSAEEFERRLARWEIDRTGTDPPLADALAAATWIRRSVPGHLVAPAPDLVAHLRHDLTHPVPTSPGLPGSPTRAPDPGTPSADPGTPSADPGTPSADPGTPSADPGTRLTHPPPGRVPRWGSVADGRSRWVRLSTWWLGVFRPWVTTGVAVAGIVVVLALQAFGEPERPPSPASTTRANAAPGVTSLGTPLTSALQPSTTTSTQPAPTSVASTPRGTAPPSPQTTRPATTAPQTTRAPRPTTTRAPTTTAATTTTLPPTTTTVAPAPT
jgi:DNA-directed RNA polymerase specialized sigma24 family protein